MNKIGDKLKEIFNKMKVKLKEVFSKISEKLKKYNENTKGDKVDSKKLITTLLLILALVIQFSFLSYLVKSLLPESEKNNENVIMNYTSNGNLDYKVYLKPNDFIKEEYLNAGEAYILDLVDHIQITSLYNFKSNAKTNVTGANKLVARLKVYYKESTDQNNNPEVLKKETVLDEKIMNFDADNYSMLDTYDLYIADYLTMLKDFQNKVKIAVDGYLEVSLETDFNGKVGGASYSDNYKNMIKIPLSNSVIKIENEKVDPKVSNVYEGDLVKTNKAVMAYLIIANVLVFVIVCVLLRKLFMFTNKSLYERTLTKILRNYDDIIVNTTSVLDVSKYKLIEIEEFKEILNLSRELLLPIMNYEVLKNEETWFYVVKDDILYRYVISEDRLKGIKNEKQKKTKEKH